MSAPPRFTWATAVTAQVSFAWVDSVATTLTEMLPRDVAALSADPLVLESLRMRENTSKQRKRAQRGGARRAKEQQGPSPEPMAPPRDARSGRSAPREKVTWAKPEGRSAGK